MSEKIATSIVGTVYNATESLAEFISKTKEILGRQGEPFEIILVDDRCPSGSWALIEKECLKDPVVKGVRLSRNFGQQIATSVGLRFAKGEYVIMMDTDLQNPPEAYRPFLKSSPRGRMLSIPSPKYGTTGLMRLHRRCSGLWSIRSLELAWYPTSS